MTRKPWPILFLAGLFVFEPLFKVGFYSLYWKVSVHAVLAAPSLKTPFWFFMFFVACPLAGIAIYAIKRWSIPLFLLVEALIVFSHFYNWQHTPKYYPIGVVMGMTLLNAVVVLYFLIPAVHLAYIDPRFRWWESKPRYQVSWKGSVIQGSGTVMGVIQNISERGLFFQCDKALDRSSPIEVTFSYLDHEFKLKGNIRHDFEEAKKFHYGVHFERLRGESKGEMARCIKSLESSGCERRPPRVNSLKSFAEWAVGLFTTGKGLLPTLNNPTTHAKPDSTRTKKAS